MSRAAKSAGGIATIYCRHSQPTVAMWKEFDLDSDRPASSRPAVCFVFHQDLQRVMLHGYGYPDDNLVSASHPCLEA